jgi:large subunit ribosomal protein L9
MKVLLKEDVNNLGYAGEVMEVADGYGRNYLIPRGIAEKVTPSVLKSAEAWRDRAAIRMQEVKKEHQALAERIEATTLEFTARAGETGKLYGSITTADITQQLNETLGTDIDRRIVVSDPLRQLGEHKITIRLSRDYQPEVTVIVNQFEEEVEDELEEESGEVEADTVEAEEELLETADESDEVEEISEGSLSESEPEEVDLVDSELENDDTEEDESDIEEEA